MNEDCFVSAEDLRLFVVADGMGGHAAGEVAARVAVESIENFIRRSHGTTDFSWPYGIEPTLSYEANRLKTAVSLANRRINRLAENHDDYLGMGTTVVCALLADGQLVVAHVGDSRLYVYEEGALIQLTQDDSWAATILGGKEANRGSNAIRHVLTNVLGARPDTQVHLLERELRSETTLLLCSDGLHGSVPHETLRDIVASNQELPAMAQALIRSALDHGSRDNITALVVRCSSDQDGHGD
ncbi:MAG: protein phosphatase 2C domain-containing protein [Acidobacteriota bacterium]